MPKPDPTAGTAPPGGAERSAAARLLDGPVRVINIGLDGFAGDLAGQGIGVLHVQWSPPAGGDPRLAALLGKLGV